MLRYIKCSARAAEAAGPDASEHLKYPHFFVAISCNLATRIGGDDVFVCFVESSHRRKSDFFSSQFVPKDVELHVLQGSSRFGSLRRRRCGLSGSVLDGCLLGDALVVCRCAWRVHLHGQERVSALRIQGRATAAVGGERSKCRFAGEPNFEIGRQIDGCEQCSVVSGQLPQRFIAVANDWSVVRCHWKPCSAKMCSQSDTLGRSLNSVYHTQ